MPNIAITNYCNLQCKYCFADDMIQEHKEFMNFETFQQILHFLSVETPTRVGIIGGEPTLHPQFDLFLDELEDFCSATDSRGLIFTNGIELEHYISKILDYKFELLVNCNSPQFLSKNNYEKMLSSLNACGDAIKTDVVRCGCNIYLECDDYSYFWNDIVDKFNPTIIRASLVSPGKCYNNWNNQEKKEEYYSLLKPRMINFIKEADRRGVKICFDCNQIPICMLTQEEKDLVIKVASKLPELQCEGGLDIDLDLQAFNCFSTYEHRVNIQQFSAPSEVQNYLMIEYLYDLMKKNKDGMCQNCEKGKMHICQGACLSFAKGGL